VKVFGQPKELKLMLYTKAMTLIATETFNLSGSPSSESWHSVSPAWDWLSSGLYYVVGEAGGKSATCKWIVLK
jgi:hypothetical protein